MKLRNISTVFLMSAVGLVGSNAFANHLAKVCKSELKKLGCTAKTDAEVHECLEQHEDKSKPNEGFSKGCYHAHEAFEHKHKNAKKEAHESENHAPAETPKQ